MGGWTAVSVPTTVSTPTALASPASRAPYSPWIKEYYDWLTGWDEAQAVDFEEGKNPDDE
jgi:hypothetical protein